MRATKSAYLPILSLLLLAGFFSSCDTGVTDSTDILSAKAGSANADAAFATFQVQSDAYTASSGTVTGTYLGEAVQTNYTSTWTTQDLGTLTFRQSYPSDEFGLNSLFKIVFYTLDE